MFNISFQTSIIAILQIFAMGAVGFGLVKKGIISEAGLKLLSFLSVNIAFPMFIFYQIIHNFDPHQNLLWWCYPLINIGLIMAGLSITYILVIGSRQKLKDEVLVSSSLHNAGYIPLLLAMTLPLGALAGKVYTAVILSIIGFDMCLWSLGVWLITRRQTPRMELKNMINPPLVSMAAGILFVLVLGPGHYSEVFLKPVKIIGESAMAIAMITIGGNLAMTKLANLDRQQIAFVTIIKLILLPLLALVFLTYVHLDPVISFVVMVQSCMPTAITLSIISRHHDTRNQDFINQCIFVTHVMCMVTLPVFLGLYGKWVQ